MTKQLFYQTCLILGLIILLNSCSNPPVENVDRILSQAVNSDQREMLLTAPLGMVQVLPVIDENLLFLIGNPGDRNFSEISSFKFSPLSAQFDPLKEKIALEDAGFSFQEIIDLQPGLQSLKLENAMQIDQIALQNVILQRLIVKNESFPNLLFDFAKADNDTTREIYLLSEDSGWLKGYILDRDELNYSRIFFFIRFSHPYSSARVLENGQWSIYLDREFRGSDLKTIFYFSGIDTLMFKIGFSTASLEAAYDASQTIHKWNFKRDQQKARSEWITALGQNPVGITEDAKLDSVYRSRYEILNRIRVVSDIYEESLFHNGQISRSPNFIRYTSGNPASDFAQLSEFAASNPILKEDLVLSLISETIGDAAVETWIESIGRKPEASEILEFLKNPDNAIDALVQQSGTLILNPGYLD